MIRRPLPLVAGAARCPSTRTEPYGLADGCARALEPQALNRPVRDFSIEPRQHGQCMWLVPVQYADSSQAAPRTHDALEGLC